MRCTTLKASDDGLGKLLDYYAGLAEDRERPGGPGRGPVDYYLDPDEPPGRWWGSGTRALGLDGEVTAEQLRALLDGLHPATGAKLGRRFGGTSARGFDCTFSAPKSVSVLWALTPDPWVRAEVLAAHDAAVDAALGWFETHGAVTRRGTDGVHQVDTRGITAALFRQHTSRTVDPQLHTHAIVSAKVQDPTGRWLSLDARFLKQQQTTIGWIYDAALRTELTARLGVDWRPNKEGRLVDLAAVPEDLCTLFSERSAQVDAKLARAHRPVERRARRRRPRPSHDREARTPSRHGVPATEVPRHRRRHAPRRVDRAGRRRRLRPRRPRAVAGSPAHRRRNHLEDDALIGEALRLVQEESATWLRADIARHLTTLVPPSAAPSAVELVEHIDRLAAHAEKRCVEVGPTVDGPTRRDGRPIAEAVTDRLFTTARRSTRRSNCNGGPTPTRRSPPRASTRSTLP